MKGLLFLAGIFFSLSTSSAQNAVPALPTARHGIIVIAHRGNHDTVPENTVASVEAAHRCSADYAELDLRTTKDGHLVLMHDASVDRTTNGKGVVSDLNLADLRKLTVHSKDGQTYRIPTFAEALEAARGKIHIYLDFKDADVAETWRQIRAAGMEKQIVVYINEPEQYQPWRQIAPGMPLMTSLPDSVQTPAQIERFLDSFTVSVLDNVTDPALLAVARRRGVAVWLDAQSRDEGPASWNAVLGKGVQGMQSDHPGALVRYLLVENLRNGKKE